MTKKQERRMKVFALRMVRVATTPRWQPQLRQLVSDALNRFDSNGSFPEFINWDNSIDRYAPGRYNNRESCEPLCDEVTRFIWDMEDEGRLPRRSNWGDPKGESMMAVKLQCCIRAAADVAAAPSAGVLGWNVGQLKAMWHNRPLPKWVTNFFDGDITTASDDTPIWL